MYSDTGTKENRADKSMAEDAVTVALEHIRKRLGYSSES